MAADEGGFEEPRAQQMENGIARGSDRKVVHADATDAGQGRSGVVGKPDERRRRGICRRTRRGGGLLRLKKRGVERSGAADGTRRRRRR